MILPLTPRRGGAAKVCSLQLGERTCLVVAELRKRRCSGRQVPAIMIGFSGSRCGCCGRCWPLWWCRCAADALRASLGIKRATKPQALIRLSAGAERTCHDVMCTPDVDHGRWKRESQRTESLPVLDQILFPYKHVLQPVPQGHP